MMKITRRDVADAVVGLLESKSRSVTVFSRSPRRLRVRATRRFMDGRFTMMDIVVTVGKPNYAERLYLKHCERAGVKPRRMLLRH